MREDEEEEEDEGVRIPTQLPSDLSTVIATEKGEGLSSVRRRWRELFESSSLVVPL